MEKSKAIEERAQWLERKLIEDYEELRIGERKFFRLNNGMIMSLDRWFSRSCIVTEYAEDMSAAKRGIFEDGDSFFLDEMSKEEMYQHIIQEISQALVKC